MALHPAPERALVLGGGDGLALRELTKYPALQQITLVDLDPAMTDLPHRFPPLGELNRHAFSDPRVQVVHADAMVWLEEAAGSHRFDLAIVDFPDPNNFALGKLYTTRFYRLLKQHLSEGGVVAVQATSPLFARTSYWCIVRTMEAVGFAVAPYHVAVPSFGEWGYVLAATHPFAPPTHIEPSMRFLDDATLATLFTLPTDMAPLPVEINRLDNQVLVRYYESEWRRWD